ncbi:hypothetical protein D0864_14329 [Hortaea werneckii]|uniref:Rhodopsin domain-containing protein n=1 Tax=Hortaea werneckii TaxID=91943 RepID=A0A3M7CIW8_HORWE|nr:hypothetical protein D0864_14329 [Hortaea werneckii]
MFGTHLRFYLKAMPWFVDTVFEKKRTQPQTRIVEDLTACQNAWISQILFLLGPGCVKISVLLFYRRIQTGTFNRKWLWCIYGAIWLTIAFTIAFLLALVFNCQPTKAYWKLYDFGWNEEYTCTDTKAINLVAGLISLISDVYAIGLPCFMVQGLKMRRREKISMNAVFLLSLSVVGAGSARTWAFFTFASDSDVTWSGEKSRIRVNEHGEEAHLVPPTPTLPKEVFQPDGIRTPKHYEEYVLQVLETSRNSVSVLPV